MDMGSAKTNAIRLIAGVLLFVLGIGISADGVLSEGNPLMVACGLAVEAVACKALSDFQTHESYALGRIVTLLGGKMGANSTQGTAITLFLLAFVFIAAGMMTGGSVILMVAGIGVLAASCMLFLKAKPWEEQDN
jgi:hypothetical protein